MRHVGGFFRQHAPVGNGVTQRVHGVTQAGIHTRNFVAVHHFGPRPKRIHEVLGGQVEAVALERSACALEHIRVGAFAPKLRTPVSSAVVGVLDFPDAAFPVLARFREDGTVIDGQRIFARLDHFKATLAALRVLALVEVSLRQQSVGCTACGAACLVLAERALLAEVRGGFDQVCFDLVPNLLLRGAGLRVLRWRQGGGHQWHPTEGCHQVEVPERPDEPSFRHEGILLEFVHVDAWDVFQGDVAVRDALVGCLPFTENHATRRVSEEIGEFLEVRRVCVAGTALVCVVADHVTEEPTEV